MAGVRVGNGSLTVPEATPVANNRGSRPGRRSRAGTGKAAFRKAMAQAASQGYAHYRGQVLTVRRDFVPSAGRAVRARAVQDRVRCLTWNCSGLSPELHAEFLKYLEVVGDIGFFSLQETHWGFDSEWTAATWHFIHSTTGKQRSGGILVGLSSKYVEHSTIKWRDVMPGRLVHIRFTYKRQQIDLVVLYQHALSYSDGEQRKELMKHRTAVWGALDTLLTALPLRSSIVLMGDFNVTLEPTKAAAGYGIHQGGQGSELKADRKRAMDLLCKHKLCALNTWGCKQFTYHHPNGASQIDYICIRQALSDGQSKQCGAIETPLASWRSSGHSVVSASVLLNWKPWVTKQARQAAETTRPVFPRLEAVVSEGSPTLERISGSLKQHCERSEPLLRRPPLRDLGVEILRLWDCSCLIDRQGRLSIEVADCFRAMQQFASIMKAHRLLRRAARERKREQTLALLRGAETAAAQNNSRMLYKYVRLLAPKLSRKKIHLRGSHGELLQPSQECTLLADYARELFKGVGVEKPSHLTLPAAWFHSDAWERAFSKLQNRRAVPLGSASVGAWKSHASLVAPALEQIAGESLCGGDVVVPCNWTSAQLIWIPKPSKQASKPENLRSLGLMSPDTKAFLLILKEHASPFVQARMEHCPQFAYRQGASTYDAILRGSHHCHRVRALLDRHKGDLTSKIMHQCEAELTGGLMCSLDLSKAFDMVDHASLFRALLHAGMPRELAGVLIEVHRSTRLVIHHGDRVEELQVSRGLRQGCPVAPMLYAAWVCDFCCDLEACTYAGFCNEHLSVFADDKHLYWEIHSKQCFQKAKQQLKAAIRLLELRCMQVSYSKSAVVFALRGRSAEEVVRTSAQWHRGTRCFVIWDAEGPIRLPVQDKLEYLGVILSYQSFEMQTVQHRVEKATQNYGMLSKPLRSSGPLSKVHRLRIYRACVLTSATYGLIAVGFTAGCIQHLQSMIAKHMRKILRIYQHGVTNKQVLQGADINIVHELQQQVERQIWRLARRLSPEHSAPESVRASQIQQQLEVFSSQDSQGTLRAVVADQVSSVTCPVCGVEFAGDYGLQMHIKSQHAELNRISKIAFVRSKHSLFGLPYCRFCRARCYNWQSLEKHIAEGGCPRIKEAFAVNVTEEQLFQAMLDEEATNPPVPPDPQLQHSLPLIDSGNPVLTCSLHEVTKYLDAFQMLRTQCGLCGQRVQSANCVKVHWRGSHPQAWARAWEEAERTSKAMKAIFVSPCSFCGISTKHSDLHATRCPAFFQVAALRHIHKEGERVENEGARGTRPRQHERLPEYSTWNIDKTPLGKAFSMQGAKQLTRASTQAPHSDKAEQAKLVGDSTGLTATVTKQSRQSKLSFLKSGSKHSTRSTPQAKDGGGEVRGGDQCRSGPEPPWTCNLRLRNPHSLCYVNSSVHAILHLHHVTCKEYRNLEFLHQACRAAVAGNCELSLHTNLIFRSVLPGWRYNNVQRDAAEYAMHFLGALRVGECSWRTQAEPGDESSVINERGGAPLMMPLPDKSCTLHEVAALWQHPQPGHHRIIESHDGVLVVQLDRYGSGQKVFTDVDFETGVEISVIVPTAVPQAVTFVAVAAVVHTGGTVDAGHYQSLLRVGHSWYLTDDGARAVPVVMGQHERQNAYMILLSSSGSHGCSSQQE